MRLRDIREDRDLTQAAIAKHLHISQNTYSQYENSVRQIPLKALMTLALFYNTSTDYLLELTDDPRPYERSRRAAESIK